MLKRVELLMANDDVVVLGVSFAAVVDEDFARCFLDEVTVSALNSTSQDGRARFKWYKKKRCNCYERYVQKEMNEDHHSRKHSRRHPQEHFHYRPKVTMCLFDDDIDRSFVVNGKKDKRSRVAWRCSFFHFYFFFAVFYSLHLFIPRCVTF
jgi:hypothetical protein